MRSHTRRTGAEFDEMLRVNLRLLGWFALPVAVGGTILSAKIVDALFGGEYVAGAVPLAVLLWAMLLAFLSSTMISALSAIGRGGLVTRAILIGTAVNVVANLVLIPRFGMVAAATVTLLTELIVFGVVAGQLPAASGLRDTIRSIPPALTMGAVLLALEVVAGGTPVLISIALGACVYVAAGLMMRSWPEEDRERVMRALRPGMPGRHVVP